MSERTGNVQTVNGPIEPGELGVTLMHEHVFCDLSARFKEPAGITKRAFAHKPFETRDRWQVTADPLSNLDNLMVDNMEDAVSELLDFKKAGGQTLVDQTTRGLGRDPEAVRSVSNLTGLNIVAGTGYYVEFTHPADMPTRSEESLAEEMTREIVEGVGDAQIRCGIIGELGCERVSESELKVVRAGARAQRATGAPLSVHTMFLYSGRDGGLRIARELERAGADLRRVVFCHQDGSGADFGYQQELLRLGLTLEYDVFGFEMGFVVDGVAAQWPTDMLRIQELKRLIDSGWIEQIVISQDICMKCMTRKYGGWGYAHILDVLVPRFRAVGIGSNELQTLMVKNPRRLLTFA